MLHAIFSVPTEAYQTFSVFIPFWMPRVSLKEQKPATTMPVAVLSSVAIKVNKPPFCSNMEMLWTYIEVRELWTVAGVSSRT